uniref:Uncharacterized protein n=1 Tax=Romanomermis culicivorax TaxID=13658 RepID=A0A915JQ18_ROMCU
MHKNPFFYVENWEFCVYLSERDVMEVHCELDEDLTLAGLNNNDESTMKALSTATTKTKGPTDFAHLANGRTK